MVLSRALLMRWTSQRNRRSYVALARASTAKSAWRKSNRREHMNNEKINGKEIGNYQRRTVCARPAECKHRGLNQYNTDML